jgi:integrase
VTKKKPAQKRRRNFSDEERRTVAAWIAENNPGLFLGVLLSYYCFIRPNELRKMQVHCIDVEEKVIRLPGSITKTQKPRTVTVPNAILPALEQIVSKYAPDRFVFGPGLKVGRSPAKKDAFYHAHKRALEQLYRSGAIKSILGLSFYSWKDSGLTDLSENISLLDLMKQAGHHDPKITMKYIHEKPAEKIRRLEKKIF